MDNDKKEIINDDNDKNNDKNNEKKDDILNQILDKDEKFKKTEKRLKNLERELDEHKKFTEYNFLAINEKLDILIEKSKKRCKK